MSLTLHQRRSPDDEESSERVDEHLLDRGRVFDNGFDNKHHFRKHLSLVGCGRLYDVTNVCYIQVRWGGSDLSFWQLHVVLPHRYWRRYCEKLH